MKIKISTDGNSNPFAQEKGAIKFYDKNNTSNTYTFNDEMRSLILENKSDIALTYTINGMTIELEGYNLIDESFEPFQEVDIVASGEYKIFCRG